MIMSTPASTETTTVQMSAPAAAAPVVAQHQEDPSSIEITVSVPAPAAEEKKTRKPRRQVTKELVQAHFAELKKLVDDEIISRRDNQEKGNKGIRFLRTVNKHVKQLEKDSLNLFNKKQKVRKATTANCGFMKPVTITQAMADFAGWNVNEQKSRVDVTRCLCAYIKEHDLNNKDDRRKIVPDAKLSALLNYTPEVAVATPLTYYNLQKLIQPLFVKPVAQVAAVPAQ